MASVDIFARNLGRKNEVGVWISQRHHEVEMVAETEGSYADATKYYTATIAGRSPPTFEFSRLSVVLQP